MNPKKLIKQKIKEIEKEKGIKILFSVESGSRSWDMSSKNSDYDIRFVYKRPLDEYLQINIPKDVIKKSYDKEGNQIPDQGCLYDFVGFDIFKFVKMLSSSNPTCIEWLMSEIIYHGKPNFVFKKYARDNFNRRSLYWHYKSMCRQNYLKYLKSGNTVTYKKYLYAMRGLVNCKFIVHNDYLPLISFPETLKLIEGVYPDIIPQHILDSLFDMIEKKVKGDEQDIVRNWVKLDTYIESFLKERDDEPKEKQILTYNILNKELRRIVNGK